MHPQNSKEHNGSHFKGVTRIFHTAQRPRGGGVLGYKRDGGVRRSLIFCTQKNTWTLYCAPKKIQD